MSRRKALRNEAVEKLKKLKSEYEGKKNSKELDNYNEDAKKEYLINLSKEYYSMAGGLREDYREKIHQAGMEEVATLETQLKEQELSNQSKKDSMEDLLSENNKLIYSTYILNNGSVEQVKNLLINNINNEQIKELVKAKLNTIETSEKNNYSEVQQMITEAESDKVKKLELQIQQEYNSNQFNYPTNGVIPIDLDTMFNFSESARTQFFD